jgi:hypothetical protein
MPHGLTIGRRCRDCLKVVRICRPTVVASSSGPGSIGGTALRPIYGPHARPGCRSDAERQMSKDDYVSVTLGTFTFFVWALIGFMQWFGS